MSSKSASSPIPKPRKPTKKSLPADDVRRFRNSLEDFQNATDDQGRKWVDAKWGIYAFYDYDGEPIYVGQTNEQLRTRIRRHLTNQRTDAVAMRILDVFEVAEAEVWPIWELQDISGKDKEAKHSLDAYEYSAYLDAIEKSRFKAILNEKIPPLSDHVDLPASLRWQFVDEETRADRGHPDIRIARRAETIARLTAVARERGEVTEGLRRVIVVQAVRLAYLSAVRLAHAEGRSTPPADAINIEKLIGSVLFEQSDPTGETDTDEMEADIDD
ncbi:GIY-YIG nuclease family protein [Arthrobacter sp. NPDC092385]|uniref:GIY-YIG nuclease family protein n=1 Tax=Arthrobacter sp. NPDC092385 TaxID=3363943 RepID=UPI0037FAF903